MTTTEILAAIGGTTVILTAAARIPAALAEFLRSCILVANAARELRDAVAKRPFRDSALPAGSKAGVHSKAGAQRTSDISAEDSRQ